MPFNIFFFTVNFSLSNNASRRNTITCCLFSVFFVSCLISFSLTCLSFHFNVNTLVHLLSTPNRSSFFFVPGMIYRRVVFSFYDCIEISYKACLPRISRSFTLFFFCSCFQILHNLEVDINVDRQTNGLF